MVWRQRRRSSASGDSGANANLALMNSSASCWAWIGLALLWSIASACSPQSRSNPPSRNEATMQSSTPVPGRKCVLLLHGKGGGPQSTTTAGDITYLRPGGNADAWGGRQWLYYPDSRYDEVREIVSTTIAGAGCE